MYTFIIAAVLALIIGSCFYGKKLWENRIAVLLIFFGTSFATYFTVAIVQESKLQTENVIAEVGDVYKTSMNDTIVFKKDSLIFDVDQKTWISIHSPKLSIIGPIPYDTTVNTSWLIDTNIDSVFVVFNRVESNDTVVYFLDDDKDEHRVPYNSVAYVEGPTTYEKVKTRYVTDNKWIFARSYPTIDKFYRLRVNYNLLASL